MSASTIFEWAIVCDPGARMHGSFVEKILYVPQLDVNTFVVGSVACDAPPSFGTVHQDDLCTYVWPRIRNASDSYADLPALDLSLIHI